MTQLSQTRKVKEFYEKNPYPPVSGLGVFFQRILPDHLPLLNYHALFSGARGSCLGAASQPRILVAGAGTTEPLAVARANPEAQILALDVSGSSLQKLKFQARLHGLSSRIQIHEGKIERAAQDLRGKFDYILATGVLHHLENPESGLRALKEMAHEKTVFRFMVYSRYGRELLYYTKSLIEKLNLRTATQVRRLIEGLPPKHPYRIFFQLYSDTATDTGVEDGYLHPLDHAFSALELESLLKSCQMKIAECLMPGWYDEGEPWRKELEERNFSIGQKMEILDSYGVLDTNFIFSAVYNECERPIASRLRPQLRWNPALPKSGTFHSRILNKKIKFKTGVSLASYSEKEIQELLQAKFIFNGEGL